MISKARHNNKMALSTFVALCKADEMALCVNMLDLKPSLPEFDPQSLHKGQRERSSQNGPLTSTCMLWNACSHIRHTQNYND